MLAQLQLDLNGQDDRTRNFLIYTTLYIIMIV